MTYKMESKLCCCSPSHVQLFAIPWTAAQQASLSLTISHSLPKFMSIFIVDAIQPSRCPLLLPSIFPNIRDFSNESAVLIRWQNTGVPALASVLPMNSWGWFLLGLTCLISLESKGLSGVFSNTTVRRHQFLAPISGTCKSPQTCQLHLPHYCLIHS